jgi:hypothetical protein
VNMNEMRGKGWRVLGYFIWMLGAGVVLDSDAVGLGSVILVLGFVLFVVGVVQAQLGTVPRDPAELSA